MEKIQVLRKFGILFLALLVFLSLAGPVGAEGSIFDSKYTKYSREIYEKYCEHHMTPGGHWDCYDALDWHGIPEMGCDDPTYRWEHEDAMFILKYGWKKAPLNFGEDIVNRPYAPKIYWFYKCKEDTP